MPVEVVAAETATSRTFGSATLGAASAYMGLLSLLSACEHRVLGAQPSAHRGKRFAKQLPIHSSS